MNYKSKRAILIIFFALLEEFSMQGYATRDGKLIAKNFKGGYFKEHSAMKRTFKMLKKLMYSKLDREFIDNNAKDVDSVLNFIFGDENKSYVLLVTLATIADKIVRDYRDIAEQEGIDKSIFKALEPLASTLEAMKKVFTEKYELVTVRNSLLLGNLIAKYLLEDKKIEIDTILNNTKRLAEKRYNTKKKGN